MPQHLGVLKHYIGKKPLFSKYATEEQIDRIYARKVPLPSGGALVLDQTEALVAIDVNSGKTTGDNVEDMAFKTNMEAAEEAARQLRLRDLAGLVVIDFIDMKREGNNRAVMERLVECLGEDKARMEVGKINRFGVLVMTRQRLRPSLQHVTHETCPTCQGTGKVKSLEALVLSVVRRIKAILSRDAIAEIRVKLAPGIALAVLNQKRKDLVALEDLHDSHIVILADGEIPFGEMAAEIERAEEEPAEKAPARAERTRDLEEETVVLGGDSPISFEKALGGEETRRPAKPHREPAREAEPVEIRYDNRDSQRAALEERERLRALFESAKPIDEEEDVVSLEPARPEKAEASGRRRGRGRGKGGQAAAAAPQAPVQEPFQEPVAPGAEPAPMVWAPVDEAASAPEAEPVPLLLTADLLAPTHRPRLLGGRSEEAAAPAVEPAPAEAEAPTPRRGRVPKAKPAPAAASPETPAPEGVAAPAKPGRRTSKAKAAPAPEAEEAPAPKPRGRKK
jgi:ribonuclease E